MNRDFGKIVAEALRHRLHPNTGLHPDQLAYAIGVSGETVRSWLRRENIPSGAALDALLRFFYSAGDHVFAIAVFGDAISPLTKRAKVTQALEAIDRAREALLAEAVA